MEVRLNSPRRKFETHFSEEKKGKLTVAQLKFRLKCHGINQSGNFKKETVGKVDGHHPASCD